MSGPGPTPCLVDNCPAGRMGEGLCQKHLWRKRNWGTTDDRPLSSLCRVDGCDRQKLAGRSLCSTHRAAARRAIGDDVVQAFRAQMVPGSAGDCWPWPGALQAGHGYGIVGHGTYAHRVSYVAHHGLIPDGLFVLHSCDNPPCVNPAHLRAGTNADNMRDAVERGRHWTPWRKTG